MGIPPNTLRAPETRREEARQRRQEGQQHQDNHEQHNVGKGTHTESNTGARHGDDIRERGNEVDGDRDDGATAPGGRGRAAMTGSSGAQLEGGGAE